MADINQLSSSPVAGEKVNKKEEMSLSQIIGAAGDYPSPPSTGPWYEKYEWCIGNDLNESAAVKKKKYNDSISSSVKSESEKTVVRPIGKVTSKSAKVASRKAVKAVMSSTVEKAAKKGLENAFKAGSKYAVNKIDTLGKRAINTGFSPTLVQNVSSAAKRGAHSGLGNLSNSTVNMMHADDDLDESAPVKRSKSNIDYSSSMKAESVKTFAPKAVGAATSSIVRKRTRKAKRVVDSAETSINSDKKKKKMKRKLQFGDDRDECCTSPIIIYIYPQNNPGKSVVKHDR